MIAADNVDSLEPEQLRAVVRALMAEAQAKSRELAFKQATIDKLTHENATLRRLKFAATSEAYSAEQRSLIEETLDADLAALAAEIEALEPDKKAAEDKRQPKRQALPANLPRREIRHEPEDTTCGCGQAMQRISEDVAEKLDYQPGVFTVERHIRGKWVCACCEKLVQAPVAPHVIDKGLPTTGLLAQVLVAKYLDHLPLYRQEHIFERAGLAIARSTLAQWVGECGVQLQPLVDALTAEMLRHEVLHADETPVAMLKPGHGKTHRAYLWSYCTTQFNPMKAVVFDFADSRGGQHVRSFLGLPGSEQHPGWKGKLVTDDFSGYKACFELGVTEVGCMAQYLGNGFIRSVVRVGRSLTRQRSDAVLDIFPTLSVRLLIRSTATNVCHRYGYSVRQDTPIPASANCSGHPADVARRSHHQRRQRSAVPRMDRPLPPLLQRSRSCRD